MQKLFNNILLPVSLNRNSVQILENGIELANTLECNLHILYILRPQILRNLFHAERKKKISNIGQQLSRRLRPGLLMQAIYTEGHPYDEIKSYVLNHEVDMVCLQGGFDPPWLLTPGIDADKLAMETNCAVITNDNSRGFRNCDKIILPVGSTLPLNSLRVAIYLAQQFKAALHLVADNRGDEESLQSLRRTFHLLKENTDLPVICNTFNGNFQQSVLNYARSVRSGLIIANNAYRRHHGFFNKLLAGEFAFAEKVPVVMVD